MRKLFLSILMIVNSFFLMNSVTAEASAQYIVTGFAEHPDSYWKELVILEENESLTADMLPTHMQYMDNGGGCAMRISWNVDDASFSEPGLHYVTGTPLLPANTAFAEDFDGTATWPVFRQGDSTVLTVVPPDIDIYTCKIPVNGNPADMLHISFSSESYRVGRDGYVTLPEAGIWDWDFSNIDVSKPGIYSITGRITLPEGFVTPENYSVSLPAYVFPEDGIEIYGLLGLVANRLQFEWIYDCANVTKTILEHQTPDGNWVSCNSDWYQFSTHSTASPRLVLYPVNMPKDTPLTLRLRYQDTINGKSTERLTQPILLTIPSNIESIINNNILKSMVELGNGDRDGGDSDKEAFSDLEQTAPENTDGANSNDDSSSSVETAEKKKKTMTETVTDTYMAISGIRVMQQLTSSETVLFELQDVSVEIPSTLIEKWNITDYDLLEITILRPQKNAVSIALTANGTPVTDLTGTIVHIPWALSDGTSLECLNDTGNFVSNVLYNEETATIQFEISYPGTFFLKKISKTSEMPKASDSKTIESSPAKKAGIIIGILVVLCITLFVIRRWQHE